MKNELLPIGSVIAIKEAELMICGYFKKDASKYDYVCCIYPSGMGPEAIFVKKEIIERVKFIGYQNGNYVEFKHKYMGDKNE